MQLTKIIAVSGLALSVMACSATSKQAVSPAPAPDSAKPVAMEIQQYDLRGFSLSIPASEGWNVAKKEPLKIVLAKESKEKQEHYAIQALVVELPEFKNDEEFLAYINSRMNSMNEKKAPGQVEVTSQLVVGQGEMCVQSHSRVKPSNDATRQSVTGKGLLELVNYTCRYPDRKNVGVYLAYSKRSAQASGDENLTVRADEVFNNMSFRDL